MVLAASSFMKDVTGNIAGKLAEAMTMTINLGPADGHSASFSTAKT